MNTQNDKQEMDRQAFIASYWGQFVLTVFQEDGHHNTGEVSAYSIPFTKEFRSYLELTPLSSITDEHAIEVAKIVTACEEMTVFTRDGERVIVEDISPSGIQAWIWFDADIFAEDSFGESTMAVGSCIIQAYDKLRELGYLTPFRSYSTQQLIDMGWVKLKNDYQ